MPRFPGEVGLIGIPSVSRKIGGAAKTGRARELEKPLKTKDAVQRLRTVTERFVAAPPERAFTETESVLELMRDGDRIIVPAADDPKDRGCGAVRRRDVREPMRQPCLKTPGNAFRSWCFTYPLRQTPRLGTPKAFERNAGVNHVRDRSV